MVGIAGVVLVLAGAALAAAVTFGAGLGPSAADSADAQVAASEDAAGTPTASSADPGAGASQPEAAAPDPVPASGGSEPFWRTKQREAEARLLGEEGGGGAVGAVAVVSFDPAREAARAQTAATAAAPASPATPAGATTRAVAEDGRTALAGVWAGTAAELSGYLLRNEASPRFTVPTETLAGYYVRYAAEAGLRADVLWAQMLHETGFGAYGGSVRPEQNNYAGIGATGGGEPGITFATAEAGVMAHVAHMAAYVFTEAPVAWVNSITDPRYDMVAPRGAARVLSDLDGRWAVPGDGYGVAIERHVRAINGS